jgi:hypothetical protein
LGYAGHFCRERRLKNFAAHSHGPI